MKPRVETHRAPASLAPTTSNHRRNDHNTIASAEGASNCTIWPKEPRMVISRVLFVAVCYLTCIFASMIALQLCRSCTLLTPRISLTMFARTTFISRTSG